MFHIKSSLSYLVTLRRMQLESHATEFSDILEVLDNTFKNVKYQKIKDIFLEDIKKDVCDLIQDEISQKITLYSQDEHQTLADKRIEDLEKDIHFLKNEIIKNFIKNDPHGDENNNVSQKMGKFRCLHAYQMTQIPM